MNFSQKLDRAINLRLERDQKTNVTRLFRSFVHRTNVCAGNRTHNLQAKLPTTEP